jgi:hypothetical protein
MGGVFGGGGGGGGQAPAPKPEPVVEKATQSQEEAGARMRGAKRRGRMLLSDTRLNPEMGMKETLGGGNSLG